MPQVEIPETPLMQQYQALKDSCPHAILFFRLGDFYEMFSEDAAAASSLLGLTLTARNGVPMCGIPFHSASGYISKLLAAGRKVAICEQISPSADLKKTKLFKREVVRLITPGTIVEDELLRTRSSNYLLSLKLDIVGWGLAWLDASTGEFFATQNLNDPDLSCLLAAVSRLDPSEIIAGPRTAAELKKRNISFSGAGITEHESAPAGVPAWALESVWQNHKLAADTAAAAAAYMSRNRPGLKETFSPAFFEPSNRLQLDESAIKTLELVSSQYDDDSKTLWGAIDLTKTAMGSRLLKKWLLEPLAEPHEINTRQKFTAFLAENREARESLSEVLSQVPDIERLLGRVLARSATPRDLSAARKALGQLPRLKLLLSSGNFFECVPELAGRLESVSPTLMALREKLERALCDDPPARVSDGGVIREGFSPALDELRSTRRNSQKLLTEIELREREKTQISSLKVSYNGVFGYYIEITKSHLPKVPHYYTRKQTLVNAERFITEELKILEGKILGAEERTQKLESQLFSELKEDAAGTLKELRLFAVSAAELDVFFSLAEAAVRYDFSRPAITGGDELIIEEGRHPVVEKRLGAGAFVPNDIKLSGTDPQIIILTGPNMSGKSVYLRQTAVIVILAQIGSFVPARAATVGVVDRIMTRIGAQDRLARGESTFMVEMRETAAILNLATPRSLILLDEVGRGTSTFDGISIAWAVVERLYRQEGGPKVLFATHYFELTELAEKFSGIKNFNIAVKEWTNAAGKTAVVFLHKISSGPADKSYGIHVAQLAGLPDAAILRAREILRALETKGDIQVAAANNETPLLPIFSGHPVLDEIKMCDPENMTPMQALRAVEDWKKRIDPGT